MQFLGEMAKPATKVTTLNGKPLPFRRNETLLLYRSPFFLATVIGFIALMVVVRPNGVEYNLSLPQRMAIWICSIVGYLIVLDATARLATWFSGYSGLNRNVPTWLLHVVLVPPVTIIVHAIVQAYILGPGIDFSPSFADIARNIFFAILTEAILVYAAFPRLQSATEAESPPQTLPRPAIMAGRNSVFLDTLVIVKSVEHYLELETTSDKQLVRMRLSDFIAQVSKADGIQPHRSYWVPRHSIVRFERDGGKSALVLLDGRRVPVARSRVETVSDWMAGQAVEPAGAPG